MRWHVLAELLVHLPVRFGSSPVILLAADILKQPPANDLEDFFSFNCLLDLFDSPHHFFERLVNDLGSFVEELGNLACQRGDHAGVRAVRDGNREFLHERQRVAS